MLILHLANKIAGHFDLTADCLESILDEEVKINIITRRPKKQDQPTPRVKSKTGLGSEALGVNFICGEYVSDYDPAMEFVIGPLKNSAVEDYLENGSYSRFLSCFYSFFVPVEMEAITTVKASDTKLQFILNEGSSNVILGYNAGI